MPHISQLKNSKFLTKEDCGRGILCTIKGCHEDNVAKEGATPEMKWVLELHEQEKPMVLNSTNGQIIAGITGSENTDDWVGHKVVLYHDPNVSFGGKLIGGIRCRAPRNQPPAQRPAPRPQTPPPARRPAPPADEYPPEQRGDAYDKFDQQPAANQGNQDNEDIPF